MLNTVIKTIKKKMVEKGRDDFVSYLGEILGISKQWASSKLSGKTCITVPELITLDKQLNFSPDELKSMMESVD